MLEGLDDIGLTLRDEARITEFEARRESWRPKTLPVKSVSSHRRTPRRRGERVGLKSDNITINGGKPLRGRIEVRGAKNLATKAMVAALLG